MSEEGDVAIAIVRMEKLLLEAREVKSSPLLWEIVALVELFKDSVVAGMGRTPAAERLHAVDLRDRQANTADILSELEILQDTSDEQNSSHEAFRRDIVTRINDEEDLAKRIKEMSEVEIPREIEESMSNMLRVTEQEETRKDLLRAEIDSARRKLQSVMQSNVAIEKELFDACAKIEREYADILAEYDRDIGALHALMEKLSKDNEIIKAKKKDMEEQLAVQRVVYLKYVNEREIALMKIFTEKLEFFRQNRAAKIIQKAWKVYFERISLKKRRKARRK